MVRRTAGALDSQTASRHAGRSCLGLFAIILALLFAVGPTARSAYAQTASELSAPDPIIPDTSFGTIDYELELLDLRGKAVGLDTFRDSVLFVNVWASWCSPCVAELSGINALQERIADRPIAFLMVSVDDSADDVRAFLQEHDVNPSVYLRNWDRSVDTFRGIVIPRTYIVSKGGRVVYRHVGAAHWDSDEIYSFLVRLAQE